MIGNRPFLFGYLGMASELPPSLLACRKYGGYGS